MCVGGKKGKGSKKIETGESGGSRAVYPKSLEFELDMGPECWKREDGVRAGKKDRGAMTGLCC